MFSMFQAFSVRTLFISLTSALVIALGCSFAQEKPSGESAKAVNTTSRRVISRLLFEDHATQSVKWAEIMIDSQKQITLDKVHAVAGFKSLDPEKQKLVQIQSSQRLVLVGVRDQQDGEHESGWVLIDSGVRYKDHGDHGHWQYREDPRVIDSRLDKQQGNPAHIYCYDGRFFLANDKKKWLHPNRSRGLLGDTAQAKGDILPRRRQPHHARRRGQSRRLLRLDRWRRTQSRPRRCHAPDVPCTEGA
jgi:hypothetical protein